MSDSDHPLPVAAVGRLHLFALGFGSIIGSAWVVILGDWLRSAGPGGAVIGFCVGGLIVFCIGCCYAELSTRFPEAGGEVRFAGAVFGSRTAVLVGWYLGFAWICVAVFEGLAVGWFVQLLAPSMGDVPLYRAFGAEVTRNQLLVGAVGTLFITAVNYRGILPAARLQGVLTYGFLLAVVAVLLLLLQNADPSRLIPWFSGSERAPWSHGAGLIFANCAFLLNGFQVITQAADVRSRGVSLVSVGRIMLASILSAVLFYCVVVVVVASVIGKPDPSALAIIEAVETLPYGATLASLVLVIAIASLVKTWNAVFLMSTRLLAALAREGVLPAALAAENGGTPRRAVLLVGLINLGGLMLGRGAVEVLVGVSATSIIGCYLLCCIALPVARRRNLGQAVPGRPTALLIVAAAIGGAALMAVAALAAPAWSAGAGLHYALLTGWSALAIVIWVVRGPLPKPVPTVVT